MAAIQYLTDLRVAHSSTTKLARYPLTGHGHILRTLRTHDVFCRHFEFLHCFSDDRMGTYAFVVYFLVCIAVVLAVWKFDMVRVDRPPDHDGKLHR